MRALLCFVLVRRHACIHAYILGKGIHSFTCMHVCRHQLHVAYLRLDPKQPRKLSISAIPHIQAMIPAKEEWLSGQRSLQLLYSGSSVGTENKQLENHDKNVLKSITTLVYTSVTIR